MFDLSLPIIISTFGIIFIAELPDKTALASLVLATKYKPHQVIIGAWLAFLIQTIIAIFTGGIINMLPTQPVHIFAGIGFLIFAFLAFRRKEEEIEREEKKEVTGIKKKHHPAWLSSFLVIFAAEWGDLTQLATAALVAQTGHPFSIFIGSVAALWTVTIIAAVSGSLVSKILTPQKLNIVSGVLFTIIGLIVIVTAFQK